MARDTSGRHLQSYISKTNTRCFARLPIAHFPEFPPVGSVNDAVHAAIARFGRLLVFGFGGVLSSLPSLERLSL
jgi:hypothetical protein